MYFKSLQSMPMAQILFATKDVPTQIRQLEGFKEMLFFFSINFHCLNLKTNELGNKSFFQRMQFGFKIRPKISRWNSSSTNVFDCKGNELLPEIRKELINAFCNFKNSLADIEAESALVFLYNGVFNYTSGRLN